MPTGRRTASTRGPAGSGAGGVFAGGRAVVALLLGTLLPAALLPAACGGRASGDGSGGEGPRGSPRSAEITVFAAASLTEAFRDAADAFRATDGGRRVALNLAGSQALAAQILAGAPADVFASADAAQMERVRVEGLLAGTPATFAENGLAVVAEAGNPRGIEGLADLARPELAVVLAAPEVPVGGYARAALEEAGVRARPVSLETDVKQVLAKVALGEADAGIVYHTDARAAGDAVSGIPLPSSVDQRARYRIGVLAGAPRPDGARRFVEFLRSPPGRKILRRHGFEVPAAPAPGPTVADGSTGLRSGAGGGATTGPRSRAKPGEP